MITIVVSGGPNQVSIPPTVINDAVDVARAAARVGSTGSRSSPSPAGRRDPGRHRDHAPARGPTRSSARGSTVTLIVSSGPGSGARAAARRSHRGPGAQPARRPVSGVESRTASCRRAIPTTARVLSRASPPAPRRQGHDRGRSSSVSATAPARRPRTTTTTTFRRRPPRPHGHNRRPTDDPAHPTHLVKFRRRQDADFEIRRRWRGSCAAGRGRSR